MTIVAKDFGSYLAAVAGFSDGAATAGGTGDATAKAGAIIDTLTLDHPMSGLIAIPWDCTLTDTKTLSLSVKIEHGDAANLSDAADYTFGGSVVDLGVVVTSDGGGAEAGVSVVPVDLSGIKRYWRVEVTPDLSATTTDTLTFGACVVLGGLDKMA